MKPLEPTPMQPSRSMLFKALGIVFLVGVSFYIGTRMHISPQSKTTQPAQVLGEEVQNNIPSTQSIEQTLTNTLDSSINQAQDIVSSTSAQIQQSVSSLLPTIGSAVSQQVQHVVVSESTKQIVNQINTLPKQDQQIIKDAVCK